MTAAWTRRSIPGHLFEISDASGPVLRIRGGLMPTLETARLLTAAPEMLEALRAVVDCWETETMLSDAVVGWCRAAITKAETA
jgi:hypothetical protein